MSETIVVKWAGVNKAGYGTVSMDDGTKWGKSFGTGSKEAPPCKTGDTITATLGENDKGYGTITDIKVESGGSTAKPTQQGGGFQKDPATQDQIMRQSAIKAAIENKDTEADPLDIIKDAVLFFEYYKNGEDSAVLVQAATGDPLEGE